MNINLILVGLQTIGRFLILNLTGILFLLGLTSIIYAVFLLSFIFGFVAIGLALILVSLIINKESQQADIEH